ncbi:MAG: acyltransferase [Micropruina sp.]|uniref:acyltransferase n=1 Tax=Micropruina sp. TaxID=2737536 RepID=UPI0039E534A1
MTSISRSAMALAKSVARDLLADVNAVRTRTALRVTYPTAAISRRVTILGDPGRIRLGDRVSISGPTSIVVVDGGGLTGSRLDVGDETYIGEFGNIRASGAPITIGARCLLAQNVTVVGSNHGTRAGVPIVDQDWSGTGVEIGDGVWIAAGCIIVPGARIGSGAVVGANSVVRGVVPENAIVAGSPARQVGERKS